MAKYDRVVRAIFGPSGGDGLEFRDHAISFDVQKDDDPKPNRATLTIWNLTDEEKRFLEEKDNVMTLFAGHAADEEDPGVLFVGAPYKISHDNDGPDSKTIIKSGDGKNLQKNVVAAEVPGKATIGSGLFYVLEGAVKDPVAAYEAIRGDLGQQEVFKDLAYHAPAREVMVKLSAANRFDWILDGDQIVILKPGEARKLPAVVVSRETGLYGYPKIVNNKGVRGLRLKVILDARHRVRRFIKVEGEGDIDGFYIVRKIKASGDNGHEGKLMMMDLEVTKVEPKPPGATLRDFPGMELLPAFQTIAEVGLQRAQAGVQGAVHVFERRLDKKFVAVDELTAKGLERAGYTLKKLFD